MSLPASNPAVWEPPVATGQTDGVPVRVKLILVVLVAAMVGIGTFAYSNGLTGDESTSFSKPEFVTRLIPQSGDEVLAQATVGIELADGYDASLIIGNIGVSNAATVQDPDGLRRNTAVRGVYYEPGPKRQVARLTSPQECVTAMIWRVVDGPETAKPVRWCFDVT